jgi:Fic family protein
VSKVMHRRWPASPDGLSTRDRRPCSYEAYVPDALLSRRLQFDEDVVADIAEAEAAIAQLDVRAGALTNSEALARILLRAEAVASSRIEGLEVGPRRLLRAEAARSLGATSTDVTAQEVLGNIDAMVFGISQINAGDRITVDLILEIHRRLLAGTRLESYGGRLRAEQNWIGGSSYNPCSAAFVPPPPEAVAELMTDLCAFCSKDRLSAVAQAAIAHAQFETIHPFVDGNGRTGRALIQLVLRRRGIAQRVMPPVSLVLATWAKDYVTGLTRTRYRGPSSSKAAEAGTNQWVQQFSIAAIRAVADATRFEGQVQQIQANWRDQLGGVRRNSAADLLVERLPGAPIVTVSSAAELIKRTFPAANNAVTRLEAAGVLKQITLGRRNRAYEAPDIITAFLDLERQLASPEGDTLMSKPSRRVPAPRRHTRVGADVRGFG